ncbi:MAG: hypothetical protein ACJAZ1_000063 [Yoonia sp.]|jgi:hypothetical protein
MTFKRLWTGMLAAVVVGLCVPVAVRGIVWIFGSAVEGPAVLAGPHVVAWDTSDLPFHENFGGLSGLLIEGNTLLAASDRGRLFQARVLRGPDGWLETPTDARMVIVPLLRNWPAVNAETDLEGLARMLDGRLVLAFERFARIDTLENLEATPRPTHVWTTFRPYFGNKAFEAVATLPDGRVLAILEGMPNAGSTVAYLWNGERGPRQEATGWSAGTDMPLSDGFVIVGADMGSDGCLYLLDRRFSWVAGFSHRIRRVSDLKDLGEVIYTSAPSVMGNAEGISMTTLANGDLIATLVTDDNFVPLPPTRLIEYRLTPGLACDGAF